ncbi:PaaI family thioesterase [Sediminicola luteus]|uniref:Thioesterase domain-containing protein n=1 Tax=Sediminicola luteus TaxID=319238 RepID=A0A2A4GC92_9FLAO|nr:PaaI family thioesterase [Sediminicola luteus]PCE66031.1 hypothetical protein B7P33_01645 [Sediminicola luteus]
MARTHYQKLESLYLNIPLGDFYDTTEIQVSKAAAEIRLAVAPKYHMGLGFTHGSVYFRLLDDACFYACMSVEEEVHLLTSRFQIEFLKPVTSGTLIAKGRLREVLGKGYVADAMLYDENDNQIAYGSGHFAKSRIPLAEIENYK